MSNKSISLLDRLKETSASSTNKSADASPKSTPEVNQSTSKSVTLLNRLHDTGIAPEETASVSASMGQQSIFGSKAAVQKDEKDSVLPANIFAPKNQTKPHSAGIFSTPAPGIRINNRENFDSDVRKNYYVNSNLDKDTNWSRSIELAQKNTLTDDEKKEAKQLEKYLRDKANESLHNNDILGAFKLKDETEQSKALGENYQELANLLNYKHSASAAAGAGLFKGVVPFANKIVSAANEATAKASEKYGSLTPELQKTMNSFGENKHVLDTVQNSNSTAGKIGQGAGELLMLASGEEVAKAGTGLIKGFSKLAPWIKAAINSGLTFGSISGLQAAGNVQGKKEWDANEQLKAKAATAQGQSYTPQEYSAWGQVGNVLKSAGIGTVGGLAGGAASGIIGELGAKVLTKYGLQTPFAEFARQTLSGTAFAAANEASTYYMYPSDYRPSKEQVVKDMAVAFLFSALTSSISTAEMTSTNKAYIQAATQEMQNEYQRTFSNTMTAADRQAAYDHILEYNNACRQALSQNYLAGQQKYVNQISEILDSVDEQIGMIKQTTNFGNSTMLGSADNIPAQPDNIITLPEYNPALEPVSADTTVPSVTTPVMPVPSQNATQSVIQPVPVQETNNSPAETPAVIKGAIEEAAATLGDKGAKAFKTVIAGNENDVLNIFPEFSKLYNLGKQSDPAENLTGSALESRLPETPHLNTAQRFAAYVSGRNDAKPAENKSLQTTSKAGTIQAENEKPYTATLYHGSGKAVSEIYNGIEYPVAGQGKYYATSEKSARNYGDNIETTEVHLDNPLVIKDDADWRKLTSAAGWEYSNMHSAGEEASIKASDDLRKYILSSGHDGLVIQYEKDHEGDINLRTGQSVKTLDRVFSHDQVVVYDGNSEKTVENSGLKTTKKENTIKSETGQIDEVPQTKSIFDMTFAEFVAEWNKYNRLTENESKGGPIEPEFLSEFKKKFGHDFDLSKDDWKIYSKWRGYTPEEISHFERWIELNPKWVDYSDVSAASIWEQIQIKKSSLKAKHVPAAKAPTISSGAKKLMRKWAANEYVNVSLDGDLTPLAEAYIKFFNKYYEAGLDGKRIIDVPYEKGVEDEFPPFLQDTFYDAGKTDAHKAEKKEAISNEQHNEGSSDRGTVLQPTASGESSGGLLADVAADNVQHAGEQGNAVRNASSGGEPSVRNADRPDAGRDGGGRSVGSGEGTNLRHDAGEVIPEESSVKTVSEAVEEKEEQSVTELPKGRNFSIGTSLDLPSGEKARYKANVSAIRLVRTLIAENRYATEMEQVTLSKYVGWGGIANVFDENKPEWAKEYAELKELLSDDEYKAARASTLNAHYTDIAVIRSMYKGLEHLGFKGGRLLEPACGVGHFAGAMPSDMSSSVKSWTMVELDPITGNIAKYLYPNADVRIEGFEKTKIPDNFIDVAISNVPFGNYAIVDKQYPKDVTGAIHNYFFAKALDKVRVGGLVTFITSRFTLDAQDRSVRDYIMRRADLLGAIRLPDSAFKSNAGTEVVTDILILKKRAENTPYSGEEFEYSSYSNFMGKNAYINDYFVSHPEMVLGTLEFTGTMYRGGDVTYKAIPGEELEKQIEMAFSDINAKMDYPIKATPEKIREEVRTASSKAKNGALVSRDGKIYRNHDGVLEAQNIDAAKAKRITSILNVRDQARNLLNMQLEGQSEANITKARKSLNAAYDAFVKENGYLNTPANLTAINEDPDKPFISALENYDKEKKTAIKADIFTKDTVSPNKTITHADTAAEGLIISVNETGGVDADRIASLTGQSKDSVIRDLLDSRLVFKNRDGDLETAEMYLSGNVKAKLRDAEALASMDKDYNINVAELKKIIPADISHQDIYVRPGSTWIPDSVYSDFGAYMLGTTNQSWRKRVSVKYIRVTGQFNVVLEDKSYKYSVENTQTWGTPDRGFINLLEALMNNKSVTIRRKLEDGSHIVDKQATIAAQEKLEKIKVEFQKWIWSDETRQTELSMLYNDMYNNTVTPKYDGTNLTVLGSNPSKPLREHQRNAVQRVISSGGNTLLAHKVGAGKTYEMAAAAMKLRQLGIVKKPMFVVPKSLVAQWGNEFLDFFPAAKILVLGENDFSAKNRKAFANRIATGDYDAVILSQEQFKAMPMSAENQAKFYSDQLDALEFAIEDAARIYGKRDPSIKQMEKAKKSFEAKLAKLGDMKKDEDNISFEEIGVDSLFVDEAHSYKNLFYTTNMQNVAGLGNKEGSQKAFDLYMKVRYLQKFNGGRGVVFATATPVMNSMSEMYIMQKYLQSDLLEQRGISSFDAWANQFGEVVTVMEMNPSGKGYRQKQSFSRFKNLGELQQMFGSFADVLTDIPGLKIPSMKEGKRIVVESDPSDYQLDYIDKLAERADAVKRGIDPHIDNMLKITSDGRKLSYSQRLVDPALPYEDSCKIFKCADNVAQIWKETKGIKGTQLIFCDMATPKGGPVVEENTESTESPISSEDNVSMYDDIKKHLILAKIPANEIAYIHDANTNEKKAKLFKDVNDGTVRILIGSTGKMGVGMNAQKRIVALHHLDAPWRPGDIEQREGRALRQGNMNDEVGMYVYVTKKTFDSRMWDNLQRKASFINQIMSGTTGAREAEGDGDFALSAAEIKALASGDPLILEQFEVAAEISKLESLQKQHLKEIDAAKKRLNQTNTDIAAADGIISRLEKDVKARVDVSGDNFKITIKGNAITERKAAGTEIIDAVKKYAVNNAAEAESMEKIGSFAGFELLVTNKGDVVLKGANLYRVSANLESPTGTVQTLENVVRSLDARLENSKAKLTSDKANIGKLEKIISSNFDRQSELDSAIARNNEIMSILNPPDEGVIADTDDDTDELITSDMNSQSVGSGDTSINKEKLPAVFSRVEWKPGTVNLDLGGGKFDNATEYLDTLGVTNYVYDKYNRSPEHNASVAEATQEGQSDTVTISNVLNVIKEQSGRDEVLLNALDAVRPGGAVYITVYEGDGKGTGKYTQFDKITGEDGKVSKVAKSWQENRLTSEYLPEVRKYFGDVAIKNKVIIAKDPKKGKLPSSSNSIDRMAAEESATDKWSASRVGSADKAPMSLSDIIGKIRYDFGIPVSSGHIRGGKTLGEYNKNSRGIKTKIANDLPTVAHELGHHLDNTYGLTDHLDKALADELTGGLTDAMKDVYPEKKWKTEGLAEFVRHYLQNRETAAIDYPKFTQYFLLKLSANDSALVMQLADEVNAYYSLDADTATSSIRLGEETGKDFRTAAEKIRDKGDELYQAWVDSNRGIKLFDRAAGTDTYKLASNSAYADAVAGAILTGDLTDINGQRVSDGLLAAISDIDTKNKDEYRDFGEYLVVKHGPERLEEGMRIFADDRKNSTKWMNFRQAELEHKYPKFKKASEKLYAFQQAFLRTWGVNTGLVSAESADQWAERWDYYVPLNRAVGDKGRAGARLGFANQNSTIKKAHGSGLDIVHPVDNIVNNIVRMVNAGMRNSVMAAITKAAQKNDGLALFLEKVPAPIKVTAFNATKLKENLSNAVLESSLTGDNATAAFDIVENIDDILFQYGRGKAFGDVITVLRGGKQEFWKINDPMLLSAVTNMNVKRMPAWLETYGEMSRFITSNLTGNNVLWSIFSNFPRDIMTMFTFSKDKNPIHILGGIGSAYVNKIKGDNADPLYKEYLAMGGGKTSAYTADRSLARNIRKKVTGDKLSWLNPMEWLEFVADAVELGPRYSYYKIMRNRGYSPTDAFYESTDITVNFRRGGINGRTLNKVIPFFNAGVQGLDKFARWISAEDAAVGSRAKSARGRMIAFMTISAALASLTFALNGMTDEAKKDYAQLSNYTKNAYWCIPMGNGKFFTIPKPREIAVLTSFMETCVEQFAMGNKHAFDGFYDYVTQQALPNVVSDIAQGDIYGAIGSLGIIGVGAYMMANRDFLGNPIVSSGLQSLEPKDQYTSRTAKIAKWIGQAFNVSPQMVDFFFQQTLGGWWKAQKALFPVGGENTDYTLGVQGQYVRDNQYSTDLVNWLYDKWEKSQAKKNSNPEDTGADIAFKWDSLMTTFYSRYYKLAKGEADTTDQRATRQTVLNMIAEYRKNADNGTKTSAQKAIENVCDLIGSTENMPTVMQSVIKDDNNNSYSLTDSQYVEYQTEYLTAYYDYAEGSLPLCDSVKSKDAALKTAKEMAAKDATSRALSRLGVSTKAYTEKQAAESVGLDATEQILFNVAYDSLSEDHEADVKAKKEADPAYKAKSGELQTQIIEMLDKMDLSDEEKSYLFGTKYSSNKNNPFD